MNNSEIIKKYDLEGDGDLGIAVDKALDEARLSERASIKKKLEIDGMAIFNTSWEAWDNYWYKEFDIKKEAIAALKSGVE